jgi:ketosteroid isomerase-like protein
MSTQDNLRIVQGIYSAFGKGDIPAILNALADDVEWLQPPGGEPPFKGTYRGRDGAGTFFQGRQELWTCWRSNRRSSSLRVTLWLRWATIASALRQPASPTIPTGRWCGGFALARS